MKSVAYRRRLVVENVHASDPDSYKVSEQVEHDEGSTEKV